MLCIVEVSVNKIVKIAKIAINALANDWTAELVSNVHDYFERHSVSREKVPDVGHFFGSKLSSRSRGTAVPLSLWIAL